MITPGNQIEKPLFDIEPSQLVQEVLEVLQSSTADMDCNLLSRCLDHGIENARLAASQKEVRINFGGFEDHSQACMKCLGAVRDLIQMCGSGRYDHNSLIEVYIL